MFIDAVIFLWAYIFFGSAFFAPNAGNGTMLLNLCTKLSAYVECFVCFNFMLLFYWPRDCGVCANYELIMFKRRKGTPPYLGFVANCCIAIILSPTPPFPTRHQISARGDT